MQVQHTVSTFTAYACIYMRNLHCAGEETKRRRRKKKLTVAASRTDADQTSAA